MLHFFSTVREYDKVVTAWVIWFRKKEDVGEGIGIECHFASLVHAQFNIVFRYWQT